ncbi:MAG: hypothetical protein LBN12_03895 [Clostridiales Family XIII bacterium]|jgi:hypothetical protein|nr:hypothetical protein [Clostridiales Family XIII bacterium]
METKALEKAPSGLAKLSVRERTMIFVLIIVGIAFVMGYFLLMPMMTEYKTVQAEYTELQDREVEMRAQIEQKEAYQQAYNQALVQYNEYSRYFYRQIDPEILDELVTGLTLASGLDPVNLTMSQLTQEGVPPYTATNLAPQPIPVIEPEAPADEASGAPEDEPAAGEDGTGAGATEPAFEEPVYTEPATSEGAASFVYTVEMTANGSRLAYYDLLARVKAMDAIEVVSFSYRDPVTEKAPAGSDAKDTFTPGELRFSLKVYVFVEGVPASLGA